MSISLLLQIRSGTLIICTLSGCVAYLPGCRWVTYLRHSVHMYPKLWSSPPFPPKCGFKKVFWYNANVQNVSWVLPNSFNKFHVFMINCMNLKRNFASVLLHPFQYQVLVSEFTNRKELRSHPYHIYAQHHFEIICSRGFTGPHSHPYYANSNATTYTKRRLPFLELSFCMCKNHLSTTVGWLQFTEKSRRSRPKAFALFAICTRGPEFSCLFWAGRGRCAVWAVP